MEAEEQDFIVLLLTLIAGKTLSKYSPPLASPVLQYVYGSVLPAPSPSPASCTDPAVLLLLKPGNAALRCAEGHQEATSPLARLRDELLWHPWMGIGPCWSCGCIPAQQAGCPGCLACSGCPWLSLHVFTLGIRIFQSIALFLLELSSLQNKPRLEMYQTNELGCRMQEAP